MNSMAEISCVADLDENRSNEQSLRVAFASMDGESVDQHFGSSQGFFVYDIDASCAQFLVSKLFPRIKFLDKNKYFNFSRENSTICLYVFQTCNLKYEQGEEAVLQGQAKNG